MKKHIFILTILIILAGCGEESGGDITVGSAGETTSPGSGKGGSLARFTINGNQLYTVDDKNLKAFSLADPANPVEVSDFATGVGIETIFSRDKLLFIGSTTGMYIYSIDDPNNPYFLSMVDHVYSCDPVVADSSYAYITTRSGSTCGWQGDQLIVYDIRNPESPVFIKEYNMTNPYGLGLDSNYLFVCDNGLKIYDRTKPDSLKLIKTYSISVTDVIPNNGNLIVIGGNALYQYKYNRDTITYLSKINFKK